jgi:branched-chain amino acid transport system ATP-binding protein
MEALRLENVSKYFGGLQALKNVSFTIEGGERFGIIGPNGSGKTTLLNVISGVLRPSSGQVYLFGKEATHQPLHAFVHLGLARTFQLNTLFPPLTILDNVLLAIQGIQLFRYRMFRPLSAYNTLFAQGEEILHRWGLWEKRDVPVKDLSYGEQRCLELVLGLVSNPKVILLDEPTAGLSSQEITVFTKFIQDLEPDITVVIVEHNLDTIFQLSRHIMVLNHGELITIADKESIKKDQKVREIYLGPERTQQ